MRSPIVRLIDNGKKKEFSIDVHRGGKLTVSETYDDTNECPRKSNDDHAIVLD